MITARLLRETFYPRTITESDDGMGGTTKTETLGAGFRGRLSSLTSTEKMTNDKVTLESTHKLFCNHQTLDESTIIVNSASTRTFEITGIINPSNSNHHLEILLRELNSNG